MTAQRDFDRLVATWLDGRSALNVPDGLLERSLAQVEATRQRPGWLVRDRGRSLPATARSAGSRLRWAVAVVSLVVVAIAGGLMLTSAPATTVGPSNSPPAATAAPKPGATLGAGGGIVFARTIHLQVGEADCTQLNAGPGTGEGCSRRWIVVVNQDGTGERRLFPDGPPTQSVLAVSPDGSHLLASGILPGSDFRPYLTDVNGSAPRLLDTGCIAPCAGDGGFAFSPDGERLAFVRGYASDSAYPGDATSTVVAVMELSTGKVTELDSTRVATPELSLPCGFTCGEGTDEAPHWSPDGRHLLFTRYDIGTPGQPRQVLDTATFTVDADGANLRQLVATGLSARDADWSPDGSLVVFTSAIVWITGQGSDATYNEANDIYTVHPDGTNVVRVTTSGVAGIGQDAARWTSTGRIVYVLNDQWTTMVIDADGQQRTVIDPADVRERTAVGCIVCSAPVTDRRVGLTMAYWVSAP